LTDPRHNYAMYRSVLKHSSLPVLPYFGKSWLKPLLTVQGVILRDIVYIEDGNKDYVESNIINFEKVLLMGAQLNQIDLYQKSDYTKGLEGKNIGLLKFLSCLQFYDEQKLEKLSLAISPLPEGSELSSSDIGDSTKEEEEERPDQEEPAEGHGDERGDETDEEESSISASFDELPEERQDPLVFNTYFAE
jgi:hypothetical protein